MIRPVIPEVIFFYQCHVSVGERAIPMSDAACHCGRAEIKTTTTVQCMIYQHVHQRLTSEPLAERLKSRRESGVNTPILKFLFFGRLFQFLGTILVHKRPFKMV